MAQSITKMERRTERFSPRRRIGHNPRIMRARVVFAIISDHGLVTWNIIEVGLAAGQTSPIYRVTNTTALRTK